MSVEFYRESPGKFDSRTLNRKTLNRWTGRIILCSLILLHLLYSMLLYYIPPFYYIYYIPCYYIIYPHSISIFPHYVILYSMLLCLLYSILFYASLLYSILVLFYSNLLHASLLYSTLVVRRSPRAASPSSSQLSSITNN